MSRFVKCWTKKREEKKKSSPVSEKKKSSPRSETFKRTEMHLVTDRVYSGRHTNDDDPWAITPHKWRGSGSGSGSGSGKSPERKGGGGGRAGAGAGTRKRSGGGGSRRDPKVTDDEMRRCTSGFCDGAYLAAKRAWLQKENLSNPYLRKLRRSPAEVDAAFTRNRQTYADSCRRTFCNPNCAPDKTRRKTRYVCPACAKDFAAAARSGAITYCQKDSVTF